MTAEGIFLVSAGIGVCVIGLAAPEIRGWIRTARYRRAIIADVVAEHDVSYVTSDEWPGHVHWACVDCGWASLNESSMPTAIREHRRHGVLVETGRAPRGNVVPQIGTAVR